MHDRYNTTKLLQLIMVRGLAEAVDVSGKAKGHVCINAVDPGLCSTWLFRRVYFPVNVLLAAVLAVVARSAEMGSRTLMAGVFAEGTHGGFMAHCRAGTWPTLIQGEGGKVLNDKIWREMLDVMEGIEPGVTRNL
jgi:hypothetical protein